MEGSLLPSNIKVADVLSPEAPTEQTLVVVLEVQTGGESFSQSIK